MGGAPASVANWTFFVGPLLFPPPVEEEEEEPLPFPLPWLGLGAPWPPSKRDWPVGKPLPLQGLPQHIGSSLKGLLPYHGRLGWKQRWQEKILCGCWGCECMAGCGEVVQRCPSPSLGAVAGLMHGKYTGHASGAGAMELRLGGLSPISRSLLLPMVGRSQVGCEGGSCMLLLCLEGRKWLAVGCKVPPQAVLQGGGGELWGGTQKDNRDICRKEREACC